MEPFDVDEIYTSDASFVSTIEEDLLSSDIISVLNEHVPASMRSDYRKFIEGVTLPKAKKQKLILKIKSILCEHYSKEASEWNEDEDG